MRRLLGLVVVLAAIALLVWSLQPPAADLRVYCAHDAVYAKEVLDEFALATGLRVEVHFDTEATKSLGLTEQIVRERAAPRCDVFWNNEPLGTVRLAEAGLLEPLGVGAAADRIPARFKDPGGRWAGFGGRFRVWIVHRPGLAAGGGEDPAQWIAARLAAGSLADVAVAHPLYGTTRAQLTAFWESEGEAAVRGFWADLVARRIQVVRGNARVKDLVAAGRCVMGLTDTDDYFLAVDAGAPVTMVPARLPDGSTLCVPNTVAIVRGCRDLAAARRLVGFLLSEENELRLAASSSRQVPLGTLGDPEAVPAQVRPFLPLVTGSYEFRDLAAAAASCLQWLRAELLR